MTQQQKDFCMEVYRAAYSLYEENKAEAVSPRFTTAQAMLETGWGKSKIGNNIFGMTVGSSWTGRKKLVLLYTGRRLWEEIFNKNLVHCI